MGFGKYCQPSLCWFRSVRTLIFFLGASENHWHMFNGKWSLFSIDEFAYSGLGSRKWPSQGGTFDIENDLFLKSWVYSIKLSAQCPLRVRPWLSQSLMRLGNFIKWLRLSKAHGARLKALAFNGGSGLISSPKKLGPKDCMNHGS